MPNVDRWVRGEDNETLFTTKTGIDYFIGDLLYVDTGDGNTVKPAGSFVWDTNLATSQETFIDTFAGVSCNAVLAAQTARKLRTSTTGVWRFDCAALASATRAGTPVGPAKQSGNLLEPQKVAVVATTDLAIGVLDEDAPVGATSVLVRIKSAVLEKGVQAIP